VVPFRTSAPVLVVFLFACPTLAQPMPGEPQPDCLHLGVVYVGATVEASFLVREPGNNPDIKPEVSAPNFVTVQNSSPKSDHSAGRERNFLFGSVEIGIDTTTAGEFSGELTVTLGQTTAKVPVSATVKEGVRSLRFVRASPIAITDAKKARLVVRAACSRSLTEPTSPRAAIRRFSSRETPRSGTFPVPQRLRSPRISLSPVVPLWVRQ
jgi:hypothetical protein